ncbi:MAG: tyrosine-protein phosphatase [Rhodospirillales bacterium]|nr:tyrosine-protein phosphatase [Rhodospirillales bacterium]
MFRGDLETRGGRVRAWLDCLLVDHGVFRLAWSNFAPVVPGRLYRANHPTPGRLARLKRRYGLKTLINLRGEAKNGSDALTREAAQRLGLAFVDLPLESRGVPQVSRILRLIEVYRTMEEPALIHCKSGADRAGLAAAVFLLAEGTSAARAAAELSLRFGHVRHARSGVLDAFVARYRAAGDKPFLAWLTEEYDEEALRREFAPWRLASFLNDRVLARE